MAKRRSPPRAARQAATRPVELTNTWSRHLQAAHELWSSGRHADALSLYAEAMRQDPNNVQPYFLTAKAYAEKFDFERMEQTLERLIRQAPRHPGAHHYAGEVYARLQLPDRAISSFEEASRLPGAGPPTWIELARLYEQADRLDEAEELIERTVASGFEMPLVALVRGRIQRRQNRLPEAESNFHAIIQRLPSDSDWTCQAWGELAQMKDAAGDWDGAVATIEHCKGVQRLHEQPYQAAADKARAKLGELIASVTRDDFRRWKEAAVHLPPGKVALLTGFPGSGTTLLARRLEAHPEIAVSEDRDFVSSELWHTWMDQRGMTPLREVLNDRGVAELEAQRRRYLRAMEYLLGEPIADRMHLDKNPTYTPVIPLMLRILPETRLIAVLRDPRDAVLSFYLRYEPLNAVSVRFLDLQRTAERYVFDMTAWLKLRELVDTAWCEVRYEDIIADSQEPVRRALATLGLEWDNRVLDDRERHKLRAEISYASPVGRWKTYQEYLEPVLPTLEPLVREFGYAS